MTIFRNLDPLDFSIGDIITIMVPNKTVLGEKKYQLILKVLPNRKYTIWDIKENYTYDMSDGALKLLRAKKVCGLDP